MKKKLETRKDWEQLLVSENICEKDRMLAMLVVIGATRVGAIKRKVAKWLELKDEERKQFAQCWQRLVRNNIFVKGKVRGDFTGKNATLELIMLGLVAEGTVRRSVVPSRSTKKIKKEG